MPEFSVLPAHVGIIMDGNGRWAKSRGLPRTAGHKEGLTAAKRIVAAAVSNGLQYLTLYTFSTENWRRAEEEVSFLMRLIAQHLRKEYEFYKSNNIRVIHSGDITALPGFVQKEIAQAVEDTKHFNALTLNLAINYGGRDEICRAFGRWLNNHGGNGTLKPGPDIETIGQFMDQPGLPDADLIIRTGGEQRISNFLLWQSAYAELYFSETLWPDYDEPDLAAALTAFQDRERRFGGAD